MQHQWKDAAMLIAGKQSFIGVARDGALVSDGLTSLDAAKQELARICSTMLSIGLTPDVKLVTFDVETIIGELTEYVDPAELASAAEPAHSDDV